MVRVPRTHGRSFACFPHGVPRVVLTWCWVEAGSIVHWLLCTPLHGEIPTGLLVHPRLGAGVEGGCRHVLRVPLVVRTSVV